MSHNSGIHKTRCALIVDSQIAYPSFDDYFSPSVKWPEYQAGQLSRQENQVYASIRKCLADAGLDKQNYGTANWNPLGAYIKPGNRVFVLCNFVEQQIDEGASNSINAKCTHGSVIRAVIDYAIIALQDKGIISFGNAPIQSCDWPKVIQQTGAARVQKYYNDIFDGNTQVRLVDLRKHVVKRSALGNIEVRLHSDDSSDYVEVNLGIHSLLEEFYHSTKTPKLRVLDYDFRRIERCHGQGKHNYLINREIIDSDVIISIPKLKTHEKVGITCGIKGCVGAVAHKDCLAHHRFGPPSCGGDEYPDSLSPFRAISSIHDLTYTMRGGLKRSILHFMDYYLRKLVRRITRAPSGSWPGNDTCWRMAVDLARIIEYSDKMGRLNNEKQRVHLMITDGVISGEGDGPLSPSALHLGYLSFADNIAVGDYINACMMGFDVNRLPIVREALDLRDYPLFDGKVSKQDIMANGIRVQIDSLKSGFGKKFRTPKEWRDVL